MNRRPRTIVMTAFALIVSLLYCSEAFAVKSLVRIQPNATNFSIEPAEGGMVRFVVIRDPADAEEPLNKSLRLVRSAHLKVTDGKRTLLTTTIAPQVNERGHLVYTFHVLKEYAPHTTLSISEIDENRDHIGSVGGGTIIEYTQFSPLGDLEALQSILRND